MSDANEVRRETAVIQSMMAEDGYGDDQAWVVVRQAALAWADYLDMKELYEEASHMSLPPSLPTKDNTHV